MKTSGIVRQIDNLGRVVIPKEMCRTLRINAGDHIEFKLEGKHIVLTRHESACVFCGETNGLTSYNGNSICQKCLSGLRSL